MNKSNLNSVYGRGELTNRKAAERTKRLNEEMLEHVLDPDILADIPEEMNHLRRNKLTHWRNDHAI